MADIEERKHHLLSLLSQYQNKNTTLNTADPCTGSKETNTLHPHRHTYAQLYNKNEFVWAFMHNEYHRCKITEVIYPQNTSHSNTNNNDIDENEATPPLSTTAIDTWSNCSTPPIHTSYDSDCSTPEPAIVNINTENTQNTKLLNHGLCDSNMPIYRVLCLTPRYKEDIACKHFIEDHPCDFYDANKCLYSHGWIEPQDRIKRMDNMEMHYTLKINDRCLAKWHKDRIWHKGKIVAIHMTKHKVLYSIQFDHYPDDVYNVNKESVVPYTSALDDFHHLHEEEADRIHCNTNTDFGKKNMIILNPSIFGDWQKHTTGIGLKYLMKYGYKIGDGLGRNKQGRSEPVAIKKIKRNVGLDFVHQNIENQNEHNMNKTKKRKEGMQRNKKRKLMLNHEKNKNVFETMNKLFSGNTKPKKKRKLNVDSKNELQRISELLFSLQNERCLYEKKMKNTNDVHMRQHYKKLLKSHDSRIKKLKLKHNYTEEKRNQDSMYEMENFKF